jgi:hypothetical protein
MIFDIHALPLVRVIEHSNLRLLVSRRSNRDFELRYLPFEEVSSSFSSICVSI